MLTVRTVAICCIHYSDWLYQTSSSWFILIFIFKSPDRFQWLQLTSRLWCVFELAAFKKANPSGKVVLKPLFLETLIFSIILALYGLVAVEEIRFTIRLNRNDGDTDSADSTMFGAGGIEALVGLFLLLPTIWVLHIIRKLFREKKELISNLRSFDLEKVGCRTNRDKNFIHSGIRAWYGSTDAFVEHVKGPLADELTEPFERTDLPTTSWLMLATPFAAATLDFFVNQCQSTGVPKDSLFLLFLNRAFPALSYAISKLYTTWHIIQSSTLPILAASWSKSMQEHWNTCKN